MRPITKYFDVLIPQVLVQVYANSVANYLLAEGLINAANAEELSLAYINDMIEGAEGNEVTRDCEYILKFQATSEGVFNFLLSRGQLSASTASEVSFYYAHEWLLAAAEYGYLRDISVKK